MWKKLIQTGLSKAKQLLGLGAHEAGDVAKTGAQKLAGTYSEALDTSRTMKGMVDSGLIHNNPGNFVNLGTSILQSPHSETLARSVARSAHDGLRSVMKNEPGARDSVENLLEAAHGVLEKNIARRTRQAEIIKAPAELKRLHTDNLHDAKAIFESGAPATLRDDAARDMARSLTQLGKHDHEAAAQLRTHLERNPELKTALHKAEKDLANETKSAREFDRQRSQTNTAELSEYEKLRQLGSSPSRTALENSQPVVHTFDARITSQQAALKPTPTQGFNQAAGRVSDVELQAAGVKLPEHSSAGHYSQLPRPEVHEASRADWDATVANFEANGIAMDALNKAKAAATHQPTVPTTATGKVKLGKPTATMN